MVISYLRWKNSDILVYAHKYRSLMKLTVEKRVMVPEATLALIIVVEGVELVGGTARDDSIPLFTADFSCNVLLCAILRDSH